MNYSTVERERLHYLAGRPKLAAMFAELADAEEQEEANDEASDSVRVAMASIPEDDFLQVLIDEGKAMADGRVTKNDMAAFCKKLDELQVAINLKHYGIQSALNEALSNLE